MPTAERDRESSPLVLEQVSKRFALRGKSVPALDRIGFRIAAGAVSGLIGPDGAGKTTLLRLAAGLLQPDEGRIEVLGIDAMERPLDIQSAIGYMPQRFGLYEDLTVQENLDLYADLQGLPTGERRPRYRELMRMTGLGPFTGRFAGALSGGMKQKLGLACTLVSSPRLLLLDEPTAGVDPVSRRELWEIIYRMVDEEGLSVLLSTAYLDEAERCRQVILMHKGRLLGHGSPASFTREVEGRVFHIGTPEGRKRRLHRRLMDSPGVVDAVVIGNGVRLVVEKTTAARVSDLVPQDTRQALTPVAPRFEDGFMVRLKTAAQAPSQRSTAVSVAPQAKTRDGDVIRVDGLQRRFGDFYAVKGISFSVRHGEVFGLLGANGAGKSTTFRMLCGLLPASAGTLRVAGQDLRRAAARARGRIGYMAQRFSLYGDLSVAENLRFFSSAYGLRGKDRRDRIDRALIQFELSDYADRRSGDLPLGYKQRLALAAALMHAPDILFLDEPTSGVDPLARREFWHRISALAEAGVTVLVTTHFMEEAEYCDRLVVMDQGAILAEDTPEGLKERFRSEDLPEPTMEDAFIGLIEAKEQRSA
jgi:ABC-2 type transport system ATP-binding protein